MEDQVKKILGNTWRWNATLGNKIEFLSGHTFSSEHAKGLLAAGYLFKIVPSGGILFLTIEKP